MNRFLYSVLALAIAVPAGAQSYQRRAALVGGGNANEGKCTVEVVVDGAAEVVINGDTGTLRNLSGQPPQWRRFQCTGPIPRNPVDFRFHGVDGRGRQELVRDPRNGAAVVRIEDPDGGAEGYTFDLTWGGNSGWPGGAVQPGYPGGRVTTAQAIDVCREEVRREAAQRYGSGAIDFRNIQMDNNPGRRDWVTGNFFLRRGRGREEPYTFSCSVNFDNGRVRNVEINPGNFGNGYPGSADRVFGTREAVQTCRNEVDNRLRSRGYGDIRFDSVDLDNRPGRNDWVLGSVRAGRGRGSDSYNFSCRVDFNTGRVRSVDLNRR